VDVAFAGPGVLLIGGVIVVIVTVAVLMWVAMTWKR